MKSSLILLGCLSALGLGAAFDQSNRLLQRGDAQAVDATTSSVSPSVTNYNDVQNPFKIPSNGFSFTAGQKSTISWDPTTKGTISLVLRSGDSANLGAGTIIARSYSWLSD